MNLKDTTKQYLLQLANLLKNAKPRIVIPRTTIEIRSDSCLTGFGGVLKKNSATVSKLSRKWNKKHSEAHINFLELGAAFKCLKYWKEDINNSVVTMKLDNTVVKTLCITKRQQKS